MFVVIRETAPEGWNKQPKKLFPNLEGAKAEALRLAAFNPGVNFDVFSLTSVGRALLEPVTASWAEVVLV